MKRRIFLLVCVTGIGGLLATDANAQIPFDARHTLKRLEENSDRFAKSLDRALDHSSLNGSRSEDEINAYVHDFEEATDRLKDNYEDWGSDPDSTREVYLRARTIDCFMRRNRDRVGLRAAGDWQVVRSDLNAFSRAHRFNGNIDCYASEQRGSVGRASASSRTSPKSVRRVARARTSRYCRC